MSWFCLKMFRSVSLSLFHSISNILIIHYGSCSVLSLSFSKDQSFFIILLSTFLIMDHHSHSNYSVWYLFSPVSLFQRTSLSSLLQSLRFHSWTFIHIINIHHATCSVLFFSFKGSVFLKSHAYTFTYRVQFTFSCMCPNNKYMGLGLGEFHFKYSLFYVFKIQSIEHGKKIIL